MGKYMVHWFDEDKNVVKRQIINNALKQEAEGIAPHYVFYDYERREAVTPAGWLVVSLWHGCIIVYRNESGRMVICPGVQGDFAYI